MNSSLTKTLLLIAMAFVALSCSKDKDPDPDPVSALPTFLNVGTQYTMEFNANFLNNGTITTIVDKQLAPDTFLIRNSSETVAVSPTQYWVLKDNIFYTSIRLRDPSTYLPECKFGQPVGTAWDVVKGGITFTYTIEALNVSITTGKGVVSDAIKIKVKQKGGNGAEAYQYISPTVGMLGNGSVGDNTATAKITNYSIGTPAKTTNRIPSITYGNFPFLAVGKYWNYVQSSFFFDEINIKILIESKISGKNIYKVKQTLDGNISYSYWYEDNGMLMVYEENENVLNADPIYMNETIATLGYGWAGLTGSGQMFIYKITGLNKNTSSFFGTLPCMEISVTNGYLSSQQNYWHKNKGNVYVSDLFSDRNVTGSNARKSGSEKISIPILSY